MEPTELVFWGTMSAAVLVGFVLAYPINMWMVDKGLKHGMGTQRVLGKGGHTDEAEKAQWRPDKHRPQPAVAPHAGHAGS